MVGWLVVVWGVLSPKSQAYLTRASPCGCAGGVEREASKVIVPPAGTALSLAVTKTLGSSGATTMLAVATDLAPRPSVAIRVTKLLPVSTKAWETWAPVAVAPSLKFQV